MATNLHRTPFPAHHVLGISPRRQSARARRGGTIHVMTRIERFLRGLRDVGRRSVFIVDNKCGDGGLLIRAAQRARALGFVAIEAKGFDRSPDRVAVARAAALAGRDPAIGFNFFVREAGSPLPVEDDEADLLLAAPGEDEAAEVARVADPDGTVVSHR